MASNSKDVAPIVFASFFNGCPLTTMSSEPNKPRTFHVLQTTKPKLLFCNVEFYDLIVKCMNELGLKVNIFTFGGQTGSSKSVECLFTETGLEDQFL